MPAMPMQPVSQLHSSQPQPPLTLGADLTCSPTQHVRGVERAEQHPSPKEMDVLMHDSQHPQPQPQQQQQSRLQAESQQAQHSQQAQAQAQASQQSTPLTHASLAQHTQQSHSLHSKSLRVDTHRAAPSDASTQSSASGMADSVVPPPSAAAAAATNAAALATAHAGAAASLPPAPLSSTSPSSGGSDSQQSSMHSSTDSSPQTAYRGLQISVTTSNSQSHSGAHSSRATDVDTDGEQHQQQQQQTHTQQQGAGRTVPASGDGQAESAMQLATPHPASADASSSSAASSRLQKKRSHEEAAGAASSKGATEATPSAINAPIAEEPETASSAASTPAVSPPAATSATPAASDSTPTTGRYRPVRTLQNSLFGQVQLAFDSLLQVEVAVKVSHAELVNPKSNGTASLPASAGPDATATARSQAGVSVLEDVRREARILRLLLGADQPPLSVNTIDPATCGLSSALVNAINAPNNAVVQPGATNPLSIRQQFLDSISKGKKSIAGFYDEVEAQSFHYLISEYISGGDLFSVLTAQPQHKVSEGVARQWFYALCCSVRYMHAHSIAHLDLSLENVCMDAQGGIRLIDFGLAAQHPAYAGDKRKVLPDGSVQRNASNHIKLLSEPLAPTPCECSACTVSTATLMATDPAVQQIVKTGTWSRMKFMCRPVCEKVHKPGKLGYMSCELYNNQAWDAYAHDAFGLGVILYSMLTGRPPFTRPDESSDVWFRVIYSGQWLMPQVRSQPPAAIYNSLSPNALHLVDLLIKPQHMRPSIDSILKHPWLDPRHAGNAVPTPVSKSRPIGMQAMGRDGRKVMQRRGSD